MPKQNGGMHSQQNCSIVERSRMEGIKCTNDTCSGSPCFETLPSSRVHRPAVKSGRHRAPEAHGRECTPHLILGIATLWETNGTEDLMFKEPWSTGKHPTGQPDEHVRAIAPR
ncbi:hypothetical protein ABW21_db0206013 [Orbilia brochopaga]|nr:hypothetical protein ABW21_db0206013 [Drechslerella brochopaga]